MMQFISVIRYINLFVGLDMPPRKTKKIEKEERDEKPAASSKKSKASSSEWDIFSDGIKDKLNQYINLNQ